MPRRCPALRKWWSSEPTARTCRQRKIPYVARRSGVPRRSGAVACSPMLVDTHCHLHLLELDAPVVVELRLRGEGRSSGPRPTGSQPRHRPARTAVRLRPGPHRPPLRVPPAPRGDPARVPAGDGPGTATAGAAQRMKPSRCGDSTHKVNVEGVLALLPGDLQGDLTPASPYRRPVGLSADAWAGDGYLRRFERGTSVQ
jgi:hypothetical protein